jgi:hypothetical protein
VSLLLFSHDNTRKYLQHIHEVKTRHLITDLQTHVTGYEKFTKHLLTIWLLSHSSDKCLQRICFLSVQRIVLYYTVTALHISLTFLQFLDPTSLQICFVWFVKVTAHTEIIQAVNSSNWIMELPSASPQQELMSFPNIVNTIVSRVQNNGWHYFKILRQFMLIVF